MIHTSAILIKERPETTTQIPAFSPLQMITMTYYNHKYLEEDIP